MTKTFGAILRALRVESEIGLRELARLIDKSPGYLSDVEHDHVPPPSEDVILKIAAALGADKKELLSVAKKMDPEISSYVAREPEAADFLRMARDRGFDRDDWEKLSQLAEIAKLGKIDEDQT
jgi:transcriptional regulator with XRE-family HTH domain